MSDAVIGVLQEYADRGVFRSFSGGAARGRRSEFRLLWLADRPFTVEFDPGAARLTFRRLLPGVKARSRMDRELRAWLRARTDDALPEHRRIDPARAEIGCVNRAGEVSVSVASLDGDLEYAVRKAVHLVNEIFLGFLAGSWHEYKVEHFNEPME